MSTLGAQVAKSLKPIIKNALINGGGYMGSAGATALGLPGSATAANGIGRALGARISKLIGSGDYASNDVTANSLIKPKGLSVQSSFGGGLGSLRIKHREFIGDISTTTAGTFTNVSHPINAGLSNTFPFLSTIATNYDQYIFHGLVFEFVSTTAGTASGAMGSVILSADYNPNATPYQNKHVMENSGYAVSSRLDGNVMYGIECAKAELPNQGYMVRNSTAATEKANYDMGTFQIATAPSTGFPANSIVGELWVTYDVELRRPSLSPNRFGYARFVRTGPATATPLGTVGSYSVGYGACQAVSVPNSTRINFDQVNTGDIFKIDIVWTGATAAAIAYPTLAYSGTSAFTFTDPVSILIPPAGVTSTGASTSFYVLVTGNEPSIPYVTLTGGTYPSSSAACYITVTCVGSGGEDVPMVPLVDDRPYEELAEPQERDHAPAIHYHVSIGKESPRLAQDSLIRIWLVVTGTLCVYFLMLIHYQLSQIRTQLGLGSGRSLGLEV